MYRIEVSSGAERDLGKLARRISRQDFERLGAAVNALTQEPRPQGVRKLKGAERSYRIRVGAYRVVYNIYDNDRLVVLLQVGLRNESTYW